MKIELEGRFYTEISDNSDINYIKKWLNNKRYNLTDKRESKGLQISKSKDWGTSFWTKEYAEFVENLKQSKDETAQKTLQEKNKSTKLKKSN